MSYDLEKMIDDAIGEGLALAEQLAVTMASADEVRDKTGPAALLMFAEAVRIERTMRAREIERPN